MFKSTQIVSSTHLLKHYREVIRHLLRNPQALLITNRGGNAFVFLNAGIYEELLENNFKHHLDQTIDTTIESIKSDKT